MFSGSRIFLRGDQLAVEPAERRALVAGDERRGAQTRQAVGRIWSMGARTSACTPVKKYAPLSLRYLASRSCFLPVGAGTITSAK